MTHDLEQRMVRIESLKNIGKSLSRHKSRKESSRTAQKQEQLMALLDELIHEEEASNPTPSQNSPLHPTQNPGNSQPNLPQTPFGSNIQINAADETASFWGFVNGGRQLQRNESDLSSQASVERMSSS